MSRKIVHAIISGLLIWSTAGSLVAADYHVTVEMQDFSNPDNIPINLKQGAPDQTVLKKLIPGNIWFIHRATLPTGGSVKEEVQIDKTEACISYSLGEEKEGKICITIAINVTKVVDVIDGVPLKKTRSMNTIIGCPIGQKICMGGSQTESKTCRDGVQQEEKKISLSSISVTK